MKDDQNIDYYSSVITNSSPELYLSEYKKHCNLLKTGDKSYILSYIFLQLYFESIFHHHLRSIINGPSIFTKQAVSRINEKDSPMKKLSSLKKILDSGLVTYSRIKFENIKENYFQISHIRNLLVHGYPVEEREHINGDTYLTEARQYLTPVSFIQAIDSANKIVENWNGLLKEIRCQKEKIEKIDLDEHGLYSAEIPHRFKILNSD